MKEFARKHVAVGNVRTEEYVSLESVLVRMSVHFLAVSMTALVSLADIDYATIRTNE